MQLNISFMTKKRMGATVLNYAQVKQNQYKGSDIAVIWCTVDVMDAIRSTYMCSPYRESSVDLLQAVSRLYKFAFRVIEDMEWDMPTDVYKCFFHMREFFGILKENKHAIPSIYAGKHAPVYMKNMCYTYLSSEKDLQWHTYMMQHSNSLSLDIHKAFNHDELIPLNQIQYYAERTRHKWKLYKSAKTQHKFDKKNGSSSSMFQSVFSWKSRYWFRVKHSVWLVVCRTTSRL